MQIEDRAGVGPDELYKAVQAITARAAKEPRLAGVYSGYQIGVPKIRADSRPREGPRLGRLPDRPASRPVQVYLGSL